MSQTYTKVYCIKESKLYKLVVGDVLYIDFENVEGYNVEGQPYHMMRKLNGEETIFIFQVEDYFIDFSDYRDTRIEDIFKDG